MIQPVDWKWHIYSDKRSAYISCDIYSDGELTIKDTSSIVPVSSLCLCWKVVGESHPWVGCRQNVTSPSKRSTNNAAGYVVQPA